MQKIKEMNDRKRNILQNTVSFDCVFEINSVWRRIISENKAEHFCGIPGSDSDITILSYQE